MLRCLARPRATAHAASQRRPERLAHQETPAAGHLLNERCWRAQVYDFCLPLLMLHATNYRTAASLRNWLRICPRKQITVLDTHDGIGGDDADGLAQVRSVTPPVARVKVSQVSGLRPRMAVCWGLVWQA